MVAPLILASGSQVRTRLLSQTGVSFEIIPAVVDEDGIKASLLAEAAPPRDVADTLAEMKARKVATKHPQAVVLGCDQILKFRGKIFSKPENIEDARQHLRALRGERHSLLSAVVAYRDAQPIWRTLTEARLTMRPISDGYLDDYVNRNWNSIRHSVGAYKLEEEGARLFEKIEGDYFTILGLPLIETLGFLATQGIIET